MKIRRIIQILLILILIIITFNIKLEAKILARYNQGFLEEKEGYLILHLKGTPYEMGYQHGVLLKEKIKVILKDYLYKNLLKEVYKNFGQGKYGYGLPKDFLFNVAKSLENYIRDEYKEEIRGLSEGAGIPYEEALLMQIFPDIVESKYEK